MSYHESFWATVGSAAPVLALAHAVSVIPLSRELSAAAGISRVDIAVRLGYVPKETTSLKDLDLTEDQQFKLDLLDRQYRLDKQRLRIVSFSSTGGMILSWVAFLVSLDALALRGDRWSVGIVELMLVVSVLLLPYGVYLLTLVRTRKIWATRPD